MTRLRGVKAALIGLIVCALVASHALAGMQTKASIDRSALVAGGYWKIFQK